MLLGLGSEEGEGYLSPNCQVGVAGGVGATGAGGAGTMGAGRADGVGAAGADGAGAAGASEADNAAAGGVGGAGGTSAGMATAASTAATASIKMMSSMLEYRLPIEIQKKGPKIARKTNKFHINIIHTKFQ